MADQPKRPKPPVDPTAQTGQFKPKPPTTPGAPSAPRLRPPSAPGSRSNPTDQTVPDITPDSATVPDVAPPRSGSGGGSGPRKSGGRIGDEMQHLRGKTIGGYQIQDLLGAGGMGAVFRARQISLDRDVALKILPDRFANHPEALARFTREALSAAQLAHHNVVQVHDVGSDQGHHYISMEFVKGETLADMIRRDGRLQVDDAAGYALQAARGLQYAHENGIIHRDIKPDNLLLNEQGVLKIADMGLAKRLGSANGDAGKMPTEEELRRADAEITLANRGLGTPAYMPPEQATDAASVDARADQYSLGCTLYYLCAGKAPYTGTTAFELITKHMSEPMTPLDVHIRNVPDRFEAIIERMLAKSPADRYPSMADVVADLEDYLGVDSAKGPYTPREHHATALEHALQKFYGAPTARIRQLSTLLFFTVGAPLAVMMLFGGNWALGGGLLGLLVLTPLFTFILDGMATKSHLFRRCRAVFFGMPLRSWGITALCLLGGVFALWVLGWLSFWLGFAVVAFGLAFANEWFVLRRLRQERVPAIEQLQKVLRELRLRGLGEEQLQEFVCRFSGKQWEEFFEVFFGYEAMLHARRRWAGIDPTNPRKRFAPWREPIARRLDAIEQARKEARERRALAKVEAQRLRAMGKSEQDAEREAEQQADDFVASERKKKDEAQVKAKAKETKEIKRAAKGAKVAGPSKVPLLFAIVRGVVGLAMVVAGLPGILSRLGIGVLNPVGSAIEGIGYYGWGLGKYPLGLTAGGLLLITAFFRRQLLGPALTVIGALMMAFVTVIVEKAGQPEVVTEAKVWQLAAVLCVVGLVVTIASRKGS